MDPQLTLADAMLAAAGVAAAAPPTPATAAPRAQQSGEPGLRRGFLLAGGAPRGSQRGTPQPAPQLTTAAGVVLPEVQAAMAQAAAATGGAAGAPTAAWLTRDLLAAVAADPVLAAGLSDPAIVALLPRLQRDPAGVMRELQRDPAGAHADTTRLEAFLRAFTRLLGDHFTRLGEATPATDGPLSRVPPVPPSPLPLVQLQSAGDGAAVADAAGALLPGGPDADVQAVLARPELAALLADAGTRRLLRDVAQGGPRALAAALRQPAQRAALELLAQHGLVRFEA